MAESKQIRGLDNYAQVRWYPIKPNVVWENYLTGTNESVYVVSKGDILK